MADRAEREAEIAALMRRALDTSDPYDGHHGNDRTDEAVAVAEVIDQALAEHIRENIRTGAS